jgi:hypothetical protein
VQIHTDPQAAEWLLGGRVSQRIPFDSHAWTCRVENLIPPRFERYAKIFHWLEAHYDSIDNPLTPTENALLGIPACEEIRGFVESRRADAANTRFRWREIAERLGVPFEPEINHEWFAERLRPNPQCWPRFIFGPAEGNLNVDERTELTRILAPFTVGGNCSFRFAEIPFIATEIPILFRGKVDELNTFMSEPTYQFSPEYWWSDDHSWCVCSEYDLAFTIVAGPSALIEAVLKSNVLEAVSVTANTRVDSRVPAPTHSDKYR